MTAQRVHKPGNRIGIAAAIILCLGAATGLLANAFFATLQFATAMAPQAVAP